MIAAGINSKALSTYMGHSSITITLDRYGHLLPGNETQAAHLLDTWLNNASRASWRRSSTCVTRLGLTNVASVSGDIDLTTADGQFQARILGAVAKKESDDKSRRIRRKHEELAERGKVSGGGSRPYGYEADKVTVRPAEAAIVKECARRFLAGESIRSTVDRVE